MSQELQLGKYEFYPYEFDENNVQTLEELLERLERKKATNRKSAAVLRKRTTKSTARDDNPAEKKLEWRP